MAHLNQVVNRLERQFLSVVGAVHDEDLVVGYPHRFGRLESRLQHGHAGEERLGPRGPELVLELACRVCDIGGRGNTGQAVDGVEHGKVVDL